MNWYKKNYKIATKSGEECWYNGHTNGHFAHNFACTLTHLKSGLKIADFNNEDDVRRVGDYLSATYPLELEAFSKAIKRKMTSEQINDLPETRTLTLKVKADAYLREQIEQFGLKKTEETTDEDNG